MPANCGFNNSVYLPYIGIAEKANTENFRQYRRILTNTENFPVNNIELNQKTNIMDSLTLIGTIIGSAAFGAVAGKLLDAFVLTRISDKYERKKWLRQTKAEAFTQLTEQMLSLGIKGQLHDDPWRFRALAAKAILLLDDPILIKDIYSFIDELYKINTGLSAAISNLPEDFSVELPSGAKATKNRPRKSAVQ